MTDSENNPLPPHGPLDESVAREFTSPNADPASPAASRASDESQPSTLPTAPTAPAVFTGLTAPPPPPTAAQRYAHLPPTLRAPWGWFDLVLLIVFSFAALVVLGIGFVFLYAALGHDPRSINPTSPTMLYVSVVLQAVLDAGILFYMLALVRYRYHLPAWSGLGWHSLPHGKLSRGGAALALVGAGILLSFFVGAAAQLFPPKTKLPVEQILQDHRTALLFMLLAVFVAPVVEETLFRGFLYPVVARSFGVPIGIVFTGLCFGLLHASQLAGGPWLIVLITLVGIAFTWIRYKTDTVLASFIVHTAYNGVQVVGLLVATHGLTTAIPHT